jgi:LmbE family N-acetylglucosaminyl deacetylase
MIHIISPHIDDAIFSCGGLIDFLHQKRIRVNVNYVFTFSSWTNPFAIEPARHPSDPNYVSQLRKNEEHEVRLLYDYTIRFFDLHDFSLRGADSENGFVVEEIQGALKGIITPEDISIWPIGIFHPDHLLIRKIADRYAARGYKLLFYEDLPYLIFNKGETETHLSQLQKMGYKPYTIPFNIETKINAMRLYKSQLSNEWLRDITSHTRHHDNNNHHERIWSTGDF